MDINAILDAYKQSGNDTDFLDHLYDVLGCVPTSTDEQISAEYKIRVLQCHPDKLVGRSDAEKETATRQFGQLSTAYRILHDPAERTRYDRWRTSGIRIPFRTWRELGAHAQAVHWQSLPTQLAVTDHVYDPNTSKPATVTQSYRPLMSMTTPSSQPAYAATQPGRSGWNIPSDDLYRKFRNYEV